MTRSGYSGGFYGVEELDFVCEQCLVAGRLAERDFATNEGDLVALRAQLREIAPDRAEQLEKDRTEELEQRTPHLVTWQDFRWPAHCGDYCEFVSEVGQKELTEMAPGGDGPAFLADSMDPRLAEFGLEWMDLPPRAPSSRDEVYDPALFLFRCNEFRRYVMWWDQT
jgi:uncharacterized protein CbrC (UPF0167 family)